MAVLAGYNPSPHRYSICLFEVPVSDVIVSVAEVEKVCSLVLVLVVVVVVVVLVFVVAAVAHPPE